MAVSAAPAREFCFGSSPTSPERLGSTFDNLYQYHHISAPGSPTRAASVYAHLDDTISGNSPPHGWEFAFDFSGQLEKGSRSSELSTADELFEAGKIRPLRPCLNFFQSIRTDSAAETEETTIERGRERTSLPASSVSRKGWRSLSPLKRRGGGGGGAAGLAKDPPPISAAATVCCGGGGGGSSRKWRMRDLLLFRSASEGRATGTDSKDPLRKYSILSSSSPTSPAPTDKKTGRRYSIDGGDTGSGHNSMRTRTGPAMSAHEMLYMENRAASKELKKKTALPFRHGLLDCLRYNPAFGYRKP